MKERIKWIDFAKGIAILFVIIAHTLKGGVYGSIIRGAIYSFHMPIFFILSCITYNYSNSNEEFKRKTIKAAKHLLLPAILVYLLQAFISCIRDHQLVTSKNFYRDVIYTLIFASGSEVTTPVNSSFNVLGNGALCFLFTLFYGRTFFDYLQLKIKDEAHLFIISIIFSICGMMLGKIYWSPFTFDIVLAVMPFFYSGYYLKKQKLESSLKNILIYGIIWIVTLWITFPNHEYWSFLQIAVRIYPVYPISFICAISGTMLICDISKYLSELKVSLPIMWIGKNSIYLFIIHVLDYYIIKLWDSNNQYISVIKRISIDLLILLIIILLKYIIKCFPNLLKKIKSKN